MELLQVSANTRFLMVGKQESHANIDYFYRNARIHQMPLECCQHFSTIECCSLLTFFNDYEQVSVLVYCEIYSTKASN